MEAPLTILYSHRLRGDLALLPRLYTYLRRLRAEHAAGTPSLLIDLGESCAPEAFPCALTGGRSTLIALDAMGYDAALVSGWLSDEDRTRLESGHLRMTLIDEAHSLTVPGCTVALERPAGAALWIDPTPAQTTHLHDHALRLMALAQGEIGLARLAGDDAGGLRLAAAQVFTLPPETAPDPTIAGVVEFILSEAHYMQRKMSRDN